MLCKRGHKHLAVFCGGGADFGNQIVYLPFDGADDDLGIHKPRGANQLLCHCGAVFFFICSRGGRNEDHLIELAFKLIEIKGSVIVCRGKSEPEIHQAALSRGVAAAHAANLRNGHVRLVDKHQIVFGEVVKQSVGGRACRSAGKDTGIVFHPRAGADFSEHFKIKACALGDALRFDELVLRAEPFSALKHLPLNFRKRGFALFVGYGIVGGGEERRIGKGAQHFACDDVDFSNALNLVSEKFNAYRLFGFGCRHNLHHVTSDAELTSLQRNIVALVADSNQTRNEFIAGNNRPGANGYNEVSVFSRVT